jgi:hypothetical protein
MLCASALYCVIVKKIKCICGQTCFWKVKKEGLCIYILYNEQYFILCRKYVDWARAHLQNKLQNYS